MPSKDVVPIRSASKRYVQLERDFACSLLHYLRLAEPRVHIRVGRTSSWTEYVVRKDSVETSVVIKSEIKKSKYLGPPVISIRWTGLDVFPLYLYWLGNRKVPTFSQLHDKAKVIPESDYLDLMTCYSFGNHIKDELYQDMVISTIMATLLRSINDHAHRRLFVTSLSPTFVSELYRGDRALPADSPLLKFIVLVLPRLLTKEDYTRIEQQQGYPSEFLAQLCASTGRALLEKNATTVPTLPKAGQPQNSKPPNAISGRDGKQKEVSSKPERPIEWTDCYYHLHTRSGSACWRTRPEFSH